MQPPVLQADATPQKGSFLEASFAHNTTWWTKSVKQEDILQSVIYLLVLHSLATRWYCEQMKPAEINSFVNHSAEKLKAS